MGTNIEHELQAFFAKHPTETFHALGIDAGYIYLDTEEDFEQRRKRYSAKWEEETRPVTADEARASEGQDESPFNYFSYRREKGEPFEAALAWENDTRARRHAEGNPYERPGSDDWNSLRYNTGAFAYEQIINLDLDRAYEKHYEKNEPKNSAYAKKVRKIVAQLEKDRAVLFRGVKLSPDFRIYAVDHEL